SLPPCRVIRGRPATPRLRRGDAETTALLSERQGAESAGCEDAATPTSLCCRRSWRLPCASSPPAGPESNLPLGGGPLRPGHGAAQAYAVSRSSLRREYTAVEPFPAAAC